ncbi:ubiquitin-protein ligase PSH1 Ecym_2684 [Eremothecium cymbalariae DBVPG|uniref:RING-type domain-containing protein n=1 Tax=Eremothecium cymbalariae (strain CBS 270.75 / DBVPG 7215 / KCTC 17166 / NRRL Y-17582) TaxID=931890 RepID=G8JNW9_ERECY|nr:Hypothetical protein Ecym_2684 [Eremothecium cymbalariae DBVPG\
MYVPVMTSCGHNYCYYCISNWLNNNNATELNCPQCRTTIGAMPALNVSLLQTLESLIDVLDKGDPEVASLLAAKEESMNEYKSDVAKNGLYRNVFDNTAVAVVDDDDGVARCSNCHWEVEGSVCPHCHARMRGGVEEHTFNSDEYSDSELEGLEQNLDEYRVRSAEIIEELDSVVGDSDESLAEALDRRFPTRQPRDFLHDEVTNLSDEYYDENKYYRHSSRITSTSEDEEFDSEMDGFIVNDEDDRCDSDEQTDEEFNDVLVRSGSIIRRHGVHKTQNTTGSSGSSDSTDSSNSEIEVIPSTHVNPLEEVSLSITDDEEELRDNRTSSDSHNSDFYEHNDGDGFVSGDSLDDSRIIEIRQHTRKARKKQHAFRKRKFMVLESDDE